MKGQVTKKRCLRSRIGCIGLVFVVLLGQVSIKPKIVRADEGVSLAEYVLTLFASMGVGISNETVLNSMTRYMNIDINSGTENIQNSISSFENALGTNFITSTFASDTQSTEEYLEIVGMDNLDGYPDYSATAAENISASIDNYKSNGFVSIVEGGKKLLSGLPLVTLAKVVGEVASVGWNRFSNWVSGKLGGGLGLLESDIAGSHGKGVGAYRWESADPGSSPYYFATLNKKGVLVGHYEDSQGPYIWILNNTNNTIYYNQHYYWSPAQGAGSGPVYPGTYSKRYARGVSPNGKAVWGGIEGNPENYIGVREEVLESPDVIGTGGNLKPGIKPTTSHNSDRPYLTPIDINVYLHWADDARQNTEDGNTGEEQGDNFLNLLIPFLKPQIDLDGIPQGSLNNPNPVFPSQPTYIPLPTYSPLASPTPATEVIPAPTLTPQQLGQELEDKTVRNLANVFPFCIPFDIVNLFKKMYVPRKAPVITWETNFGQFGSGGSITIDFSMFDGAASVCRTFEIILFILGLMIATKNLIGWGG